jgi:signal transduction histidine kinase
VKSYVEHRDGECRRSEARHIGFITHELRNPLAVALGAAGQIRKLSDAGRDIGRHLELLDRSLKRVRRLIDESLVAQRLEVGEVEFKPSHVKLGEIVEESVKGAEETVKRKGVELELSYDPEILLYVDQKLAVSALQNVVDNAAKFTDRGRVLVQVKDDATEVTVHVFDECQGLSAEELNTIFEPFKRGHTGKAGTGLGLAIARRAVEAHDKTIHAESTAAHGCHFWFALPKASH